MALTVLYLLDSESNYFWLWILIFPWKSGGAERTVGDVTELVAVHQWLVRTRYRAPHSHIVRQSGKV